jgi:hypothetical protein
VTQVYQFVDDNGVTRLFAEIVPDPAGTFNGGTITDGLEIVPPSGTTALKIASVDGNSTKMIDATALHTTFTVDSDGTARLLSDDHMAFIVGGTSGSGAALSVSDSPSNDGVVLSSAGGVAFLSSSKQVFQATPTACVLHYDAAPADGELVAGDVALWLDATDGAAKLMVKAKTANGTVATAAIALA